MADGENALVTRKGRQKMARARAEGTIPKIAKMAFGTGGADAEGRPAAPEEGQEDLKAKVCEAEISSREVSEDGLSCRYVCVLPAGSDADGAFLSELALVDEAGDAVGIKNFAPKGKDADCEMEFAVDDVF